MTQGQKRAVRELGRLHAAYPDGFEIVGEPSIVNGRLRVLVSLRLGPMETRPGGLELREREEFVLSIPRDFPFEYPTLFVTARERFARFSHVIWSDWICLYQTNNQWNPADGLYGFFERLVLWLRRAAINDMDPPGVPLEPPHYVTDFSQPPFVIRCNAPVDAGATWYGLAELVKYPNRTELVAWNDLQTGWPTGRDVAVAVILPNALPLEFPQMGADFFRELFKQGLERDWVLKVLAIASHITPEGEPIHIVLGLPMRRTVNGTTRLHVAVWSTSAEFSRFLRTAIPRESDTEELRDLRQEISGDLFAVLEKTQVSWCRVMEARDEIVVRRDKQSPIAWLREKKLLILGCGALGSWAAEIIIRANPSLVHVVDNAVVGPGLLTRQNYSLRDIGKRKADALAERLREISGDADIKAFGREAHGFITEEPKRLFEYDLILDCTASVIFQMKCERDWRIFEGNTPSIISLVIDSTAQRSLCAVIGPGSDAGPWDTYMQLKYRLCLEPNREDFVSAFYSERPIENVFQPEPGCSEPTFVGSTADVCALVSSGLNLAIGRIANKPGHVGLAFSNHSQDGRAGTLDILELPELYEAATDSYRVRISENVFREARAWVKQNGRKRSRHHETGGLLWGLWDDAIGVIWVFDASGPPPDSRHDPGHFICGVKGTAEEHERRTKRSHGACGFVGFWHTHPDMPSEQSGIDVGGMAKLVSIIGQNQRRAMMLIFGRTRGRPTVGIYIYESNSLDRSIELISVGTAQVQLDSAVV